MQIPEKRPTCAERKPACRHQLLEDGPKRQDDRREDRVAKPVQALGLVSGPNPTLRLFLSAVSDSSAVAALISTKASESSQSARGAPEDADKSPPQGPANLAAIRSPSYMACVGNHRGDSAHPRSIRILDE